MERSGGQGPFRLANKAIKHARNGLAPGLIGGAGSSEWWRDCTDPSGSGPAIGRPWNTGSPHGLLKSHAKPPSQQILEAFNGGMRTFGGFHAKAAPSTTQSHARAAPPARVAPSPARLPSPPAMAASSLRRASSLTERATFSPATSPACRRHWQHPAPKPGARACLDGLAHVGPFGLGMARRKRT